MQRLFRTIISPWLLCPLLALLLLAAGLLNLPGLRMLEYPVYDGLLSWRKEIRNQQVVLIAIDPESRAQLGEAGSAPATLRKLVENAHAAGARQIALLTPLNYRNPDARDSKELAAVLSRYSVVLAVEAVRNPPSAARGIPAGSLIAPAEPLPPIRQLLSELRNPLAGFLKQGPADLHFLMPNLPLMQKVPPVGHLIFEPDADGRIRNHRLLIPRQDRLLGSLPLQLALQASGKQLQQLQVPPSQLPGSLRAGHFTTPVMSAYRSLLDLTGNSRAFETFSAVELLNNRLKAEALHGKTVLIGPTEGYGDSHPLARRTPTGTSELAALATATLLNHPPAQRPTWGWLAESGVLLYFTLLLILLVPRLSFKASLAALGLFLCGWLAVAAICLAIFGLWLKVMPVILLNLIGFTLVRRHLDRREKTRQSQENHRIMAQRFLEQGLLDLALEKALAIDPGPASGKDVLYNLGLEFERKRLPHNAVSVYRHLQRAGRYRDTGKRLERLARQEKSGPTRTTGNGTLVLDQSGEKPTLGRYRIERELGQGAMGTVYLGIDPKISRQVAIKTLAYQQIDPDELPRVKERFFREAEAAGRLNHPNIVTIYDVGEETDLAFLAMELLDGKDLSHYCRAGQRLTTVQVVDVISQTAAALAYAHQQDIVHRDIKPSNIILLRNGQIKVADFGIAKVTTSSQTETGIILGTPNYMSPEQVAGKKVDGRSDLFSLGIVMYELLSGSKPFQGENLAALMYNISNGTYQPLQKVSPKLPSDCYAIVTKLLQKALTRRYKSAQALLEDLADLQKRLEK